jgi:ABC-type multidrug transport system ATPase subunit
MATNIEASGLSQGYGPRVVLRDIDLSLTQGVTGLLGPNGAGKTTLLRTLATVVPSRTGRLTIDGRDATRASELRAIRRGLAYLPQSFGFPPNFTVEEFVQYSAWLRGVPRREIAASTKAAIKLADLTEHAKTKVRKLSGGMRQRAGIASALVGAPTTIILDEPTVGLDPLQRIKFRDILAEAAERFEACVLLSTHLVEDIGASCKSVIVIDAGRAVYDGALKDFINEARSDAPGATDLERSYSTVLAAKAAT